jgi:hypothetical protein
MVDRKGRLAQIVNWLGDAIESVLAWLSGRGE